MLHLGIDLGTSNSAAAIFDGTAITVVRNAQGSALTPSIVRIDARGGVQTGARAQRFLESDAANTRTEFKRLMGTSEALEFPAAKTRRTPPELAAEILKSLRADVQSQFEFMPETAVIAVPALFELPQSNATAEAARLAGFSRIELLQEPVASALAAGWTASESGGNWLVYDLGGGTFDVSLLESEGGLLRVVGHDGDNFLGGRDIDWGLVDWALEEIAAKGGPRLSRADPRTAPLIRRLKQAAEEAKIEVVRGGSATILLPDFAGGFDVDLPLTREVVDAASLPVIDRSLKVCARLLETHRLLPKDLARIVLVGGPTGIPLLRSRVAAELLAPIAPRLDPMTLVAQGAAVYAATANLDARPKVAEAPKKALVRQFALRHPAMSSDLSPHVVGKLGEGPGPAVLQVQLVREDGWSSGPVLLSKEGAFAAQVELLPRKANGFSLQALGANGETVEASPARFSIVQGLTISDPPLSRSIGVARADDTVQTYFARGSPLPARRTFVLKTIEAMTRESKGQVLRVPIVQGESERAHLCRLVGALEISASELRDSLPAGTAVELTLEVDRGGRLSASALALGQLFSKVAQLVVPDVTVEMLREGLASLEERCQTVRRQAFQHSDAEAAFALSQADSRMSEIRRDADAALGGDADSAQKARRSLMELYELLESVEERMRWPDVEARALEKLAIAFSWVAAFGTDSEKKMLEEAAKGVSEARGRRDIVETERQLKLVSAVTNAAFFRGPAPWQSIFEEYASRVDSATDLPRATALVARGRAAAGKRDEVELHRVVDELEELLPVEERTRRLGWSSGVR
jgi:molecular chaperone DnaK